MVIGRNNEVVRLMRFQNKEEMTGLSFGTQKSACGNKAVVLTGWSYGGFHCIVVNF